ncbi:MAG TPA: GNAT family N-acetyltransferase [Streptosporangiaceae bacterium]|nr:GNAT family N-acetyltransferase [Streptosporangiaceae bacterium]
MTLPPHAGLTLRTVTPDDVGQILDLDDLVFNQPPSSERSRELHRELHRLERGRGVGVFDGDELAGVATLDGFTMSVPGGQAPMAGVLFVGVKPTHTRRGVMSAMMTHQLRTLHDEGREPLAGLTASEAAIYGRFGFAQAAYRAVFSVPKHRSGLRPVAGISDVTLRLVPTADSVEVCERIHARQVGTRAGMLVRDDVWAQVYAADLEEWRDGRSALRTVLASRAGEPAGYARYRSKDEYADGAASGYTEVGDMFADDVAAFAALARYLMDLDLTGGVTFRRQPVDSPLMYLLTDIRSAQVAVRDGLYLRIVDVDRALALRTYSAPVDLVLEITDAVCPWNAGRWRLSGDEKSASCVRVTDADPDLALDILDLAAAYLGGSTLAALGQAGLVRELRAGALTDGSRAFATDLAPWLQFGI